MKIRYFMLIFLALCANLLEFGNIYVTATHNAETHEKGDEEELKRDEDSVMLHEDAVMKQLLIKLNEYKPLKSKNRAPKKPESRCDRHFGSMYGTKTQKLKCIDDLTKKSNTRSDIYERDAPKIKLPQFLERLFNQKDLNVKKQFDDHTKREVPSIVRTNSDQSDSDDDYWLPDDRYQNLSNQIWNHVFDYYEFADAELLKRVTKNEKKRPHCGLARNSRKFGITNLNPRASSSETESEEQPLRSRKRRPKRFKIVPQSSDESDWSKSSDESASSRTESDVSAPTKSIEIEPSSQDDTESESDSSEMSSSEVIKPKKIPRKAKNAEKYSYMQGRNRLLGAGLRRRLPYFMPKRYHWDRDDLPNLGYYWFNGPRGRYAEPFRID